MAHYKSQLDAQKGHNGGINERKTKHKEQMAEILYQ